jgi:hypothetical protein
MLFHDYSDDLNDPDDPDQKPRAPDGARVATPQLTPADTRTP